METGGAQRSPSAGEAQRELAFVHGGTGKASSPRRGRSLQLATQSCLTLDGRQRPVTASPTHSPCASPRRRLAQLAALQARSPRLGGRESADPDAWRMGLLPRMPQVPTFDVRVGRQGASGANPNESVEVGGSRAPQQGQQAAPGTVLGRYNVHSRQRQPQQPRRHSPQGAAACPYTPRRRRLHAPGRLHALVRPEEERAKAGRLDQARAWADRLTAKPNRAPRTQGGAVATTVEPRETVPRALMSSEEGVGDGRRREARGKSERRHQRLGAAAATKYKHRRPWTAPAKGSKEASSRLGLRLGPGTPRGAQPAAPQPAAQLPEWALVMVPSGKLQGTPRRGGGKPSPRGGHVRRGRPHREEQGHGPELSAPVMLALAPRALPPDADPPPDAAQTPPSDDGKATEVTEVKEEAEGEQQGAGVKGGGSRSAGGGIDPPSPPLGALQDALRAVGRTMATPESPAALSARETAAAPAAPTAVRIPTFADWHRD